jgi:glyoxylase-like metal-dependent hydrolase (beta-lactamase superfamily II)
MCDPPVAIGLAWHIVRNGALATSPVHSYEALSTGSGQSLDLPGRPRIVAVPGHTPGSVAVHFSQTSHTVVLTGDALVTSDGIAGRSGPSIVNAACTHVSSPDLSEFLGLKPRRKSP